MSCYKDLTYKKTMKWITFNSPVKTGSDRVTKTRNRKTVKTKIVTDYRYIMMLEV